MSPSEFFYTYIGAKLGAPAHAGIKAVRIPQRVKEGVKDLSLGQMDCFYIATPHGPSRLIGRIELPSRPDLQFVDTETTSARRYIAQWLLNDAAAPFIVGVIGKAHPEASYRITHHLAATQFCDTAGNFPINVELARVAHRHIARLDWKKIVAPAIHAYNDYIQASHGSNQEKDKLQKLLAKTPEITRLLPIINIRPGSGEYTMLSWANIEQRLG